MFRNQNLTVKAIYILSVLLLFCHHKGMAQKEGNIWYFGQKAGLDFNSGTPVTLTNGALSTDEGCATISNAKGQLLFYTDGITVWNRNHNQMPNGSGLYGDPSSTQSGVIVPHPGDTNLYYVFTVAAMAQSKGMCFSLVDMRKDNGRGDVIQKNTSLFSPSAEKITAVRHENGKDVWVIGHEWGSKVFRAYLVTTSGINTTPVLSSVGSDHNSSTAGSIGQMAASTDGSRIALTCYIMENVELFDFDNKTGKLSNPLSFPSMGADYGISFSPDNTKLYIANCHTPAIIVQYDLTAGSSAQIISSKYELARFPVNDRLGELQIATDGKIYSVRLYKDTIDVIENPNAKGSACNYKPNKIYLAGRKATLGLPTFIQSYFKPSTINFKYVCEGDSTLFSISNSEKNDTLSWDFGDPNSGAENASSLLSPRHRFSRAGKYPVKLTVLRDGKTQSVSASVEIYKNPEVILPADTEICTAQSLLLDASSSSPATFLWSDGSTDSKLTITEPGKYWVQVTNKGGCISADTILIRSKVQNARTLGKDTMLCPGNAYTIKPDKPVNACRWSDGSTGPSLTVNYPGIYWADMTLDCGTIRDSIRVSYVEAPEFSLGRDTQICEGSTLVLNGAPSAKAFRWSDGSTGPSLNVRKAGIYWADMTFECSTVRDSIKVEVIAPPKIELGRDTQICAGDQLLLHAAAYSATYKWQDGSTDPVYKVTSPGTYTVTVSNACGQAADSIHISFFNLPHADLGRDTLLCIGDSLVWEMEQPFATYRWQDGSSMSRYVVRLPGLYSLEVNTPCRTAKSEVNVDFEDCTCYMYAPNSFSPNADGENDSFNISYCRNRDFLLQIYNRWGERVFESTDIRKGWDGTFRGQVVQEGVYLYTAQVRGQDRSWRTVTGHITVVR